MDGQNVFVEFRSAVALRVGRTRGNVTGVCLIAPELEVKRLSLLREALPSVHRVAVMSNHRKIVEAGLPPLRKAAAEAGLELVEIWVEGPNDYAAAFEAMRGFRVEALDIVPTPELLRDSEKLGALALRAGLPTIGGFRESAERGLLIGYGPSLSELSQQAAGYVERILGGTQTGELPFQGPRRLDFRYQYEGGQSAGADHPAVSQRKRRHDRMRSAVRTKENTTAVQHFGQLPSDKQTMTIMISLPQA